MLNHIARNHEALFWAIYPHNSLQSRYYFTSLYLWNNWGTYGFSNLPRNAQLISSRVGTGHQGSETRHWSSKCYTKEEATNTPVWSQHPQTNELWWWQDMSRIQFSGNRDQRGAGLVTPDFSISRTNKIKNWEFHIVIWSKWHICTNIKYLFLSTFHKRKDLYHQKLQSFSK